jgi:hypothetical protein
MSTGSIRYLDLVDILVSNVYICLSKLYSVGVALLIPEVSRLCVFLLALQNWQIVASVL